MLSMLLEDTSGLGRQVKHLPILFLSTLPLLAVSIYVLYDVHYRTSHNSRDFVPYDDDYYDQEGGAAVDDDKQYVTPSSEDDYLGVSLTVILYIFLLAFVVLGNLTAYYAYFMSKRQELLEKYTIKGYVVNNANLHPNARVGLWKLIDYLQCRFVGRYDVLTYAHPDPNKAGIVGLAASAHGSTSRPNQEGWVVKKLVRRSKAVMDRQRQMNTGKEAVAKQSVVVVLLPDCPQSGLIRDDVEYDAAYLSHFRGSNRYKETLLVLGFWIVFTLSGAIYLVVKMGAINAQRDSFAYGVGALCATVLVITPVVAYGYNSFRWAQHERFSTNSGIVTQGHIVNEVSLTDTISEDEVEMGHVYGSANYLQMF